LTISYRRTLNRELEERAQLHPDKPFLIFQPVDDAPLTFSYADFAAQVNRTANALLSLDVRPTDKLLLVLANCPEVLLLWLDVAILYTSGTTSRPKGCLITHANYIHAGEAVAQHAGIGPEDRNLVVLPYFHGNAQYYSTMSALVVGASLVVTDRFSASRFWGI